MVDFNTPFYTVLIADAEGIVVLMGQDVDRELNKQRLGFLCANSTSQ